MRFAYLKAHTQCSACGNPLIISSPGPQFHCRYCMSEIRINKEILRDLLATLRDALTERRGSYTMSFMTRGFTFGCELGRTPPECPSCGEALHQAALSESALSHGEAARCGRCNAELPVMQIPSWLRKSLPKARYIIGAVEERPDGEPEKPAIEGVVLACPKCGGGLEIDGMTRIVPCTFCGSNVYLPDDLWLRLHPVKKATKWWVAFE